MSSASFVSASSQYLTKVNMPTGCRSVAGWAYRDSAPSGTLFSFQHFSPFPFPGSVTHTFWAIINAGGAVSAGLTNGAGTSGTTTTTTVAVGDWFHWCVTINGSNIRAYLNGGGKGTGGVSGTLAVWPRHALASDYGGGNYLDGKLAHVATWSGTVLSDADVLSLYEARCPPMDVVPEIVGVRSLKYYAILDNSYLCDWTSGTTQLKWSPQNSPTWSDEDPGVYPMIGGVVQL